MLNLIESNGIETCAICLENFPRDAKFVQKNNISFLGNSALNPKSMTAIATKCNHFFHEGCLAPWINQCGKKDTLLSCPSCRNDLQSETPFSEVSLLPPLSFEPQVSALDEYVPPDIGMYSAHNRISHIYSEDSHHLFSVNEKRECFYFVFSMLLSIGLVIANSLTLAGYLNGTTLGVINATVFGIFSIKSLSYFCGRFHLSNCGKCFMLTSLILNLALVALSVLGITQFLNVKLIAWTALSLIFCNLCCSSCQRLTVMSSPRYAS